MTLYRLIGLFIPNPPISHLYNFTHKNITPKALLFTYSELVVSTSCLHSQVFSIAPYQSDLAVPKIIYIDNGLHFCHPDSLESTVLSPPQSQSAAQEYASRIERSLYLISESTSFKPFICLHPKASDASEFFTIPVSEISDTLTAASNARLVVSSYSTLLFVLYDYGYPIILLRDQYIESISHTASNIGSYCDSARIPFFYTDSSPLSIDLVLHSFFPRDF